LLGRIEASSRQYALGVYAFAILAFLFSLELLPELPVFAPPPKPVVPPELVLVLGLRDYFQIRPST
jgi:hypothetical protein